MGAQPLLRGQFLHHRRLAGVSRAGFGGAGGDRLGSALFGYGAFRSRPDAAVVVRFRDAVPAAQLFRPGRDGHEPPARTGARGDPEPVLLPRQRAIPPAAGAAGHRRDLYRQPGGDFGCLLDHPSGDAAWIYPSPVDPPHQRDRGRPDLHPGRQLGADGGGHHPGADLPELVQPRRRLWHRGDRRGDHRYAADGRIVRRRVEVEMVVRGAGGGAVPDRRWCLFRRQPHQGGRWRLVPAGGGAVRLHPAHDLGARP